MLLIESNQYGTFGSHEVTTPIKNDVGLIGVKMQIGYIGVGKLTRHFDTDCLRLISLLTSFTFY